MLKLPIFSLLVLGMISLSSCYQVHSSDDELRTIPVTNNPNIVPQGQRLPAAPM